VLTGGASVPAVGVFALSAGSDSDEGLSPALRNAHDFGDWTISQHASWEDSTGSFFLHSVSTGMFLSCKDDSKPKSPRLYYRVFGVGDPPSGSDDPQLVSVSLKWLPPTSDLAVVYSNETLASLNRRCVQICLPPSIPDAIRRLHGIA
jgi:hypothetical protein